MQCVTDRFVAPHFNFHTETEAMTNTQRELLKLLASMVIYPAVIIVSLWGYIQFEKSRTKPVMDRLDESSETTARFHRARWESIKKL